MNKFKGAFNMGSKKQESSDDGEYDEYPDEFENEFEALNAPSDRFYELNTYDWFCGKKVEYIEDEPDENDPKMIDGLLVDVVNTDFRDHQQFTELIDELKEWYSKLERQR